MRARAAIVALLDMAAERRRPARRDRAHDAALAAAEMPGVIAKIGVAMAAEDVGELDAPASPRPVTRAASPPGKAGPAGSSSPLIRCVETCV